MGGACGNTHMREHDGEALLGHYFGGLPGPPSGRPGQCVVWRDCDVCGYVMCVGMRGVWVCDAGVHAMCEGIR